MSRSIILFAIALGVAALVPGQNSASISGTVADPSGSAVSEATIAVTNLATRTGAQTTSDANGKYAFMDLTPGSYSLRTSKPGFETYERGIVLQAGQNLAADIGMSLSAVQQTVVVNGGSQLGTIAQPSQADVFLSEQTVRVIDRTQMDMLGPAAGAAQVIGLAPGARVTGYGNTGATKYTISINGINQGWGGYNGYTGGASLGITFDGIPIVDPATGLWQSATVPQMQLIQDTVVAYGPGDPAQRWYTNVGGSVEFTPLQPGDQFHGDLMLTYGSYNQKNVEFDINSPIYKGWSTIFAGGGGMGDDFRNGPDGFGSPSKDLAFYDKTLKRFKQSSFDLGGYYVHSGGYRSQVIPTSPVAGITTDGTPTGAPYSQLSSGFYSTLPYDNYNKYDVNVMGIVHARENIHIDDNTQLNNLSWFTHIRRLHDRLDDVYAPGPQQDEWNNPHTDTYGDQVTFIRSLPRNLITIDGYFIHGLYNTRNNFYNPADGGAFNVVNVGGKIRSGDFTQNDAAAGIQDRIRIASNFDITAGIRYAYFSASYFNNSLQDFNFVPGVALTTHCTVTLASTPGNTTDQGSSCANFQGRSGYEPSISASYHPLPWLSLYGGYQESLRSPSLGGGGGLFQSVDPYSYHLSLARYGQFGFKIHSEGAGLRNNLIYGANVYRLSYSSQEIDIGLANGDTIAANGAAQYQGLNYFLDDDPAPNLHVFMNGNAEGARYTSYVVGGLAYNGSPVPYVPSTTFNLGATYNFKLRRKISLIPVGAFQFVGRQYIFDNSIGAPSSTLTMASYGTVNLGVTAPFKHVDFILNALNILNRKYNEYLYVSSGGYFGTPFGGYELAYPAAPFTVYGSLRFHF